MARENIINLFPHMSGALSMKRYRVGLKNALQEIAPGRVRDVGYERADKVNLFKKFIGYLWRSLRVARGINLVLSERFSFLLLVLRPSKTIVVCHDMVTLLNPALSSLRKLRYKIILRWMSRARYTVCISESTRQDLLRLNPFIPAEKVKVIPNGIEPFWSEKPSKLTLPEIVNRPYFLVVGTDAWNKNFALTIRALSTLPEHMDFCVVKVGPISSANQLLIGELNVGNRIIVLPFVEDETLRILYHRAIALIFPSSHEGFGWPPLEAMICGCPVIATQVSSIPEVCGDAAYYVDPKDSRQLATAMQRVFEDDDLRKTFQTQGKLQAEKFSWQETARRFVVLTDNLQDER